MDVRGPFEIEEAPIVETKGEEQHGENEVGGQPKNHPSAAVLLGRLARGIRNGGAEQKRGQRDARDQYARHVDARWRPYIEAQAKVEIDRDQHAEHAALDHGQQNLSPEQRSLARYLVISKPGYVEHSRGGHDWRSESGRGQNHPIRPMVPKTAAM